jgi:hypothetical protein
MKRPVKMGCELALGGMAMRRIVILLTVLMFPVAASGQANPERLASPPLPDFITAHSASNASQSIREEIPRGETVQAWTRMITTQRFVGLARTATPAQYAQNVMAAVPQACPGARVSPLSNLSISGRSAVRFQLDCPRSAGGRPETFILQAIAGSSDMHVKQVAWRGGTTPARLAWGRQFLAATVLCQPRDRQLACG